jgi:nucleoside-diphosphate-sugar epimerase
MFCFGLGYSAERLARALAADGWALAGTCRDEMRRDELRALGYDIHLFRGEEPLADRSVLEGTTHLLSSVPPGTHGDPVLAHHAAEIAGLVGLEWVGYLSTTGVYGDRDGDWVDEDSALRPTGPRGERRLAAEAGWLELWRDHGLPVHLFRLAGIYGPGRNALETVRRGRARRIVKPGQVFGRIHVDDIVATLCASIARPNPGAAYNLADDEAAAPQDVILHACELLGIEPPPEVPIEEAGLSDMAASFYRDNKRVRNRRIKEELGVTLQWPDYRLGLKGLLE